MTSGRLDPQVLEAIREQGLALHQAGRLDEAERCYDKVLKRNPKHFGALHLLGLIRMQTGRAEQAVELLKRAVRLNPNDPAAQGSLGAALSGTGCHEAALARYDRAIALQPGLAGVHYNRAVALQSLMRPAEALASLDAAIALDPGNAGAHHNRGSALVALGRPEDALASYDRAIALKPDHAEAFCNRGLALKLMHRTKEALASYDIAIALAPNHAPAHNNRGSALEVLGRPEEALASYDRAIALQPGYAEAFANRGLVLRILRRLDEALASYEAAIALDPGNVDAHLGKSFLLLLTGQFESGWREYEWRKATWGPVSPLEPARAWTGEGDLAGKRLLLQGEQGLGDTLQFARYVPLLVDRGIAVTLCVQTSLVSLLGASLPGVSVIAEGEPPPQFDWHCALMSLPLGLAVTPPPPLRLDASARRADWAARLGPKTRPRVGLAWSGNPNHFSDHNRSIEFDQLTPLLGEDVEWVAIQNGVRASDAEAFAASGRVAFFGEALGDFADTAALVEQMDLVICVDTSLAHLAAALGKPTWILLQYAPDWRWMLDCADSHWYPTVRLFRQPALGDWANVIADVRTALRSSADLLA
jgi:tetratricopeptide (TPR) repeat protein